MKSFVLACALLFSSVCFADSISYVVNIPTSQTPFSDTVIDVDGYVPNTCYTIPDVKQEFNSVEFKLTIYIDYKSWDYAGETCQKIQTPFLRQANFGKLEKGFYTVEAFENGESVLSQYMTVN